MAGRDRSGGSFDSDVPLNPSSTKMVQKQLDQLTESKANKEWAKEKFAALEVVDKTNKEWADGKFTAQKEDDNETRQIAVSAIKKAGVCHQEDTLKELRESVASWNKWFRGAIIALFGFLLTAGVPLIYQFASLGDAVADTNAKADKLEVSIQKIETSQQEISRKVERATMEQVVHQEEMKTVVQDAIKDALEPPARRGRGRSN
jgi:ATP-dependent Clp protease ATP-binding subunit ClpA